MCQIIIRFLLGLVRMQMFLYVCDFVSFIIFVIVFGRIKVVESVRQKKKTAEKSRSLNILYKYNDENDTRLENVIKVWKKNALITQTLYLPLLSATFHFYFTFVKLKQMQNCLTKMI